MSGLAPNYKSPWTEQEVRRVQKLKADGCTTVEIAERVGRTQAAVMSVLLYPRRGHTYVRPDKPKHVTAARYSAEWWRQNDAAFVAAMRREHPERETCADGSGRFSSFDAIRRAGRAIDPSGAYGPSSLADMAE